MSRALIAYLVAVLYLSLVGVGLYFGVMVVLMALVTVWMGLGGS